MADDVDSTADEQMQRTIMQVFGSTELNADRLISARSHFAEKLLFWHQWQMPRISWPRWQFGMPGLPWAGRGFRLPRPRLDRARFAPTVPRMAWRAPAIPRPGPRALIAVGVACLMVLVGMAATFGVWRSRDAQPVAARSAKTVAVRIEPIHARPVAPQDIAASVPSPAIAPVELAVAPPVPAAVRIAPASVPRPVVSVPRAKRFSRTRAPLPDRRPEPAPTRLTTNSANPSPAPSASAPEPVFASASAPQPESSSNAIEREHKQSVSRTRQKAVDAIRALRFR